MSDELFQRLAVSAVLIDRAYALLVGDCYGQESWVAEVSELLEDIEYYFGAKYSEMRDE